MSEQSIQSIEKDAVSRVYRERVVIIENDLASLWAEVTCHTTQHTVDQDFLEGVPRALSLHKKASQKRVLGVAKNHEKVLASEAAAYLNIRKFPENMKAKVDRF